MQASKTIGQHNICIEPSKSYGCARSDIFGAPYDWLSCTFLWGAGFVAPASRRRYKIRTIHAHLDEA